MSGKGDESGSEDERGSSADEDDDLTGVTIKGAA